MDNVSLLTFNLVKQWLLMDVMTTFIQYTKQASANTGGINF